MPFTPDKPPNLNDWMAVAVTLAVLGTALFVIVRQSSDTTSRLWATGIAGTIVGYWLRGTKRGA